MTIKHDTVFRSKSLNLNIKIKNITSRKTVNSVYRNLIKFGQQNRYKDVGTVNTLSDLSPF